MKTSRRSSLTILSLVLALLAGACGRLEPLSTEEALDRLSVATSQVYDAQGNVIANLHGEVNRRIVPIGAIPEHVRNAVLAIEDQRFWTHQGLDLRSILRAVTANFRSEANGRVEGGSTISQQLAKQLYFAEPDRTLARKISEAQVTLQLERAYTKSEILEMYLNTIYLGRGVYGFETASRSYFGKSARDLTLAEGAFLAGIIHLPARYEWTETDPPERRQERHADAMQRREQVLQRMEHLGFISEREAAAAGAEPLELQPPVEPRWEHPYFVDLVLKQLGVLRNPRSDQPDPRFDFLGTTANERSRNVYRGGLQIYTTLDGRAQEAATNAMTEILPEGLDKLSAALVAIEPATGYIRALVGGRDYYPSCEEGNDSPTCLLAKVNLALGDYGGGTGRQPGSAFKTFVLAAALQMGIPLYTLYGADPFTYVPEFGDPWPVSNYDGSGAGAMTVLDGTARSVNALFARLEIEGVGGGDGIEGAARVAETARRTGIGLPTAEELRERCGEKFMTPGGCTPADVLPSIALGAKEVSPLDMASAYATFANDGIRIEPTAIVRIEDAAGRILYQADPGRLRAVPSGVARGVTYALEQVVNRGTGTRARIDRPAAGKTGTSQEWHDAWFVGYTPQLAAAVWAGNAGERQESLTPSNGYPLRVVGGTYPAQIWGQFMRSALEDLPVRNFPPPPSALFRGSGISDPQDEDAEDEEDLEASPEPEGPPQPGVVPSVIGSRFGEARQSIRNAGYNPQVQRGCDPTGRSRLHEVYAQSPGGGTEAPRGSTVTAFYQGGGC